MKVEPRIAKKIRKQTQVYLSPRALVSVAKIVVFYVKLRSYDVRKDEIIHIVARCLEYKYICMDAVGYTLLHCIGAVCYTLLLNA